MVDVGSLLLDLFGVCDDIDRGFPAGSNSSSRESPPVCANPSNTMAATLAPHQNRILSPS